jgi:hypothetical protein
MDGSGVNSGDTDQFKTNTDYKKIQFLFPVNPEEDSTITKQFQTFFAYNWKAKIKKALKLL